MIEETEGKRKGRKEGRKEMDGEEGKRQLETKR